MFSLRPADEASLVNNLMAYAANNPSPILRRLALEALYKDRRGAQPEGPGEPFRLLWEVGPALRAFLEDPDAAVQTAAAGAVGRLAYSTELAAVAQPVLRDRAPAAVVRLLEALGDRLVHSTGQAPEMTQAIAAVGSLCLDFGNEAVEQQAGWLSMNDPEMSLEAKVRLCGSFKKAPARSGAIRALGASNVRAEWTSKLVLHLLADTSPAVRAAVFQYRLPARANANVGRVGNPPHGEDNARLYLQGLRDPDPNVRLAALKALGPAFKQSEVLVQCLKELAANDPEAEVRAFAAERLGSAAPK